MSIASTLPAATRRRRAASLRRAAAWLAERARNPRTGLWLVISFALLHGLIWTLTLTRLKAAQDIHMDVAEAFAWGQKLQLGYGKHPPLSGWIAGLWFSLFPVTDWATYALAMATLGVALVVTWLAALRVVDTRRAFFATLMLALYPIFNFKGFKYNPDLLQVPTLALLVLAYLHAFGRRSVLAGVLLGIAAALAMMTKYWAVTMIGAIGIAALVHPARMLFLRSPAPWVAIVTFVIAMLPHLLWLKQVNFVALTYANDVYTLTSRAQSAQLVFGYVTHNLGLVAAPVALALLALAWPPRLRQVAFRRGSNGAVNLRQACNVWWIQAILAVGPPVGALILIIYIKTDWGIPLFFLAPLALVALPALRIRMMAMFQLAAIWLVISLATLIGATQIAEAELKYNRGAAAGYAARSQLARELTEAWRARFGTRWAVVAGLMDVAEPMVFYSPDHPAPFTPGELWSNGLTSPEEAQRLGFIGICDAADGRLKDCEEWFRQNGKNAERIVMTTQRFWRGLAGPPSEWRVYIVPPAK